MKTVRLVVIAVLALTLIGLGFWGGCHLARKPSTLTESTLIETVRQVAKLVTIEHHMADIVTFEEESPWPIFGRDRKGVIIARGKVLAGFDLKKPIACRIAASESPPAVDVRLPAPEIIAVDATYHYYDVQNLTREQHEWLLTRAQWTLRTSARKAGVLRDAERSLAQLLAGLFPNVRFALTFGDRPYTDSPAPPDAGPESKPIDDRPPP